MKINMTEHSYPGMLITFCGLDGCGKTTLINHLVALLNSKKSPPTNFMSERIRLCSSVASDSHKPSKVCPSDSS